MIDRSLDPALELQASPQSGTVVGEESQLMGLQSTVSIETTALDVQLGAE